MIHQAKKVWVWLNVWVYDQPRRGSKVQNRIIPFTMFHRFLLRSFQFYPPLNSCATNMYHSAFNSRLKAAWIICQSDRHAPSHPAHLRFPFRTESPAGRFSSLPLWPGFQVDRMTNGVWSPFLIRCNRTPCFWAPPGEMCTWKRGAFVAMRRYGRSGPDSLQMQQCALEHWPCAGRRTLPIAVFSQDYSLFALDSTASDSVESFKELCFISTVAF